MTSELKTLICPGNHGVYDRFILLPGAGSAWVTFQAKTSNDIHVGLLDESEIPTATADAVSTSLSVSGGSGRKLYEFVIGGKANAQSFIRYVPQGTPVAQKPDESPCSADSFRDYWVSYSSSSKKLVYGSGASVGKGAVLEHSITDDSKLYRVAAFAFSSWNVSVEYKVTGFGVDDLEEAKIADEKLDAEAIETKDWVGKEYLIPGRSGTYELWHPAWKTDSGSIWIKFAAKTTNDIHLCLVAESLASSSPPETIAAGTKQVYELVLGAKANTKSFIRIGAQGDLKACKESDSPCSSTEFVNYWVCLDNSSRRISYGMGDKLFDSIVLDLVLSPEEFFKIKYFGFSSWNAPVTYKVLDLGQVL